MFKRRVKLAQTQADMVKQANEFLFSYRFPVTEEYRKMFGMFVQQDAKLNDDTFCPSDLAKAIRRARANEFAFYLIYPEKLPKPKEEEKEADNAPQGPQVHQAS